MFARLRQTVPVVVLGPGSYRDGGGLSAACCMPEPGGQCHHIPVTRSIPPISALDVSGLQILVGVSALVRRQVGENRCSLNGIEQLPFRMLGVAHHKIRPVTNPSSQDHLLRAIFHRSIPFHTP